MADPLSLAASAGWSNHTIGHDLEKHLPILLFDSRRPRHCSKPDIKSLELEH